MEEEYIRHGQWHEGTRYDRNTHEREGLKGAMDERGEVVVRRKG